jgi:hypothetical protein
MVIYIDNFLIVEDFVDNIKALKIVFSNKFKISDLGICYFYFGMEMIWDQL